MDKITLVYETKELSVFKLLMSFFALRTLTAAQTSGMTHLKKIIWKKLL